MEQKWTNEQVDQLIRICGISREELGAMLNLTRHEQSFNRKTSNWAGTTALMLHFLREDLSKIKGYEVVDGLLRKASHGFD